MSLASYGNILRRGLRGYGRQMLEMQMPVYVHPREILQRQKNIVIAGSSKQGKSTFVAGLRELYLAQDGTIIELTDMKQEPIWRSEINPKDVVYHHPDWGEPKLAPKGSPQYWALRSEMRGEDYKRAENIFENLRMEPHSSVQGLISNLKSGKINIVADIEFLKLREMLGGGQPNSVQRFLQDFFSGLYVTERGVKYATVIYDEAQGEIPSKKGVSRRGQLSTSNIVGSAVGKFASYLGRFVFSTFNITRLAGPILDVTHYYVLFQIPMKSAMGELEVYWDAVHLLPQHVFTLVRNDSRFTPHVSADPSYEDHYPDLVHFEELKYPPFWVQPFPAIPSIPQVEAQDNITMALIDGYRSINVPWSTVEDEINSRVSKPVNINTVKSEYRRWKKNRIPMSGPAPVPVTPQSEPEAPEEEDVAEGHVEQAQ